MSRKIIFAHRRAVGDALMFTCGIRDFKLLFPDIEINVDSNFADIWTNNPYINKSLKKEQSDVEYYRVGYPSINTSNSGYIHFTQAFLLDMITQVDAYKPLPMSLSEFTASFCNGGEKILGEGVEAKEPYITYRRKYKDFCNKAFRQYGDIHLSQAEKTYNMIKEKYNVDKYWVVAPGGKSDFTTKIWDWRRFQNVIDHFDNKIKFVTIGRSDHILEKFTNVIDLTDKTSIRDLIPLVYHSEGCISGISFLMHLAAAVPSKNNKERKPCVSIYGGREPTSFTYYTNHQVLHTNGAIDCCESGGCWQARVIPLKNNVERNKRLCRHPITVDGKEIQLCMDMIKSTDVINAIERYHNGNLYTYITPINNTKEINVLASLKSKGGGEQSIVKIVELLRKANYKVNVYPWDTINEKHDVQTEQYSFKNGMIENMKVGLPLLFYANDQIYDFCDQNNTKMQALVDKSSKIIIGINFVCGTLAKSNWLAPKVSAIIFQNEEKKEEFSSAATSAFKNTKLISLFGAIDLSNCLNVQQLRRKHYEPLVVLKHGMPDYRKYVTDKSLNKGDNIHLWQKHILPELDVQFYERLVQEIPEIRFEFMEAHPEIVQAFANDTKHFVFHKFDSMSIQEFLARGHIYLYKTSKALRDQYPRVVAEALAAGLPVLGEPRDGVKDRIIHGETGFYCIDYDAFAYALKLLKRKEDYRYEMGKQTKKWAKDNLDPTKWIETIDNIFFPKAIK